MTIELLIALGLPMAYLVITTAVLAGGRLRLSGVLQRQTTRDALLWNTLVGISIGAAALHWALNR